MINLFIKLLLKVLNVTKPFLLNVFILIFMTSVITLGEVDSVKAENEDVEYIQWSLDTYDTSHYKLTGYVQFEGDVDSIVWTLPDSNTYTLLGNGGAKSRVQFYDAGDDVIDSIYLEDFDDNRVIRSDHTGEYTLGSTVNWFSYKNDYYDFDLDSLGLTQGLLPPDYAYFHIYLKDEISLWDSTMRDALETYVQDYYEYEVFYKDPDYRDHYFLFDEYYDTGADYVYYVSSTASAVNINYEQVGYKNIFGDGTNRSYISFYDGLTPKELYYLDEYTAIFSHDLFIPFVDTFDVGDYTHYRIVIYSDQYSYEDMLKLGRGLEVTFVPYEFDVEFWSEGTLYTSSTIRMDELVTEPTDPTRLNYEFLGWYLPATSQAFRPELFDFDSYVDVNTLSNGTLKMYAEWRLIQVLDEYDTTDPTADTGDILNVLTEFGLGEETGRVMFYLVAMISIIIVSFKLQIGAFASVIMCLGVTSVFVVLGFLSTLVTLLSFTALALTGVLAFKGGA